MEQKLYILMLVKEKFDYVFLGMHNSYEGAFNHIVELNQNIKNIKIFNEEEYKLIIENNEYIILKSEINQIIKVNENIEESEENLKIFKLQNKNRIDKTCCFLS